jgi:hypothetical protein
MIALLSGCGPRYGRQLSGDWTLLNRPPMLFMRVFGSGPMPPPPAPVTYELCYDFAQNKVVEVRDSASGRNVETSVAELFRAWKWSALGSVRTTGGLRCWRERFEPSIAVDGSVTIRATPAGPIGLMHLDDGSIMPARGRAEDEEYVAFVDRFEDRGVQYVMLAPRVTVGAPPSAPPPPGVSIRVVKLAGEMPHLLDVNKMRFRGNTMHTFFRVCIDVRGRVAIVLPELPLDGETIRIEQTIKGWIYTRPTVPTCSLVEFTFGIRP